ncbi:MAG TPA: nucleotide exchange factor GrpE [Actinomycetota bacterium]|jgi:molecular chaperone GrpE
MSENDRTGERPAARPKVKVTDRRRVRQEEAAPPTPPSTPSDTPESGNRPSTPEPELAVARKEAAEYRDHLMRLQAEFANYRKRVLKEQTRALELAAEPIVRRMLEVLDEFELALMAAEQRPDFEKFLHGVELVYAKLVETLKSEGLERIDAEGKPFDPERHEALMGSGAGDGEPVVADVLRQGYVLKGRVVRPAGVRVTHER